MCRASAYRMHPDGLPRTPVMTSEIDLSCRDQGVVARVKAKLCRALWHALCLQSVGAVDGAPG